MEVTHVSLVFPISLREAALKPLLLLISGVYCDDLSLDLQSRRFLNSKAPKEHITDISMTFYVKEVITPDSEALRAAATDPEALVYLIMEG
jgi:hypothetical protein